MAWHENFMWGVSRPTRHDRTRIRERVVCPAVGADGMLFHRDIVMGKLTLSRLPGQTIVIGEHAEISVTVLRLRGRHVDISITAEDHIPINRLEIYEQKINGGPGTDALPDQD